MKIKYKTLNEVLLTQIKTDCTTLAAHREQDNGSRSETEQRQKVFFNEVEKEKSIGISSLTLAETISASMRHIRYWSILLICSSTRRLPTGCFLLMKKASRMGKIHAVLTLTGNL